MSTEPDLERLAAWADVLDDSNYYEILGVLEIADDAAIKAAFRDFALAFHPDVHLDASEAQRALARDVYRRGAEAYRVLSDPKLRAKYDEVLARGHLRLATDGPARHIPGKPVLRSLEDVCRTPAAKLCARKADDAIGRNDLAAARRFLREALSRDDGENPELEERIEGLELALFAMGE
jgi:curved DNA-binding protein CbpA